MLTSVEALTFSDGHSATISERAEVTSISVDDLAGNRAGQIVLEIAELKTGASYTQTYDTEGNLLSTVYLDDPVLS